jgi:hypothetical protein
VAVMLSAESGGQFRPRHRARPDEVYIPFFDIHTSSNRT